MKRLRETCLDSIEKINENLFHIAYENHIYKWNNPKDIYLNCINDNTYDCEIINSVLFIIDIRSETVILSQPLQKVK